MMLTHQLQLGACPLGEMVHHQVVATEVGCRFGAVGEPEAEASASVLVAFDFAPCDVVQGVSHFGEDNPHVLQLAGPAISSDRRHRSSPGYAR